MIIGRISLLVEIITILFCIHMLYGKKLVLNLPVIIIVSIDLIVYEFINTHMIPRYTGIVIYVALILYSVWVFECSIKELIWNFILLCINMGILQMIVIIPVAYLLPSTTINAVITLICNILVFVLMLMIDKFIGYINISKFTLSKRGFSIVIVGICMLSVSYGFVMIRITSKMSGVFYIWIVVFCTLMCIACYNWLRQKELTKEREIDLQTYEIYYDSFQALLQELREKQHDFKNHIQAICNQHYMYDDYESLVREQNSYCEELLKHDKYTGLLGCRNSIIAGFLYGKFLEIEKQGIGFTYEVGVVSKKFSLPMYILIESIGVLVDNAVEYVRDKEEPLISIDICETSVNLMVKVENPVENLTVLDCMKFFDANQSSKGQGRGLGLTKVKKYSEKYKWDIKVDIKKKKTKKDSLSIELIIPL